MHKRIAQKVLQSCVRTLAKWKVTRYPTAILIAQNHATEIKLRAERKAGELLGELEKDKGGRPEKTPDIVSAVSEYRQAIESAEVEERQARRWQEVAKIPEPIFEEHIAEVKESKEELSTAGVCGGGHPAPPGSRSKGKAACTAKAKHRYR